MNYFLLYSNPQAQALLYSSSIEFYKQYYFIETIKTLSIYVTILYGAPF